MLRRVLFRQFVAKAFILAATHFFLFLTAAAIIIAGLKADAMKRTTAKMQGNIHAKHACRIAAQYEYGYEFFHSH